MSPLERQLSMILRRYMSEIVAQSVRRRALGSLGLVEGELTEVHLPKLLSALDSGIRLFVDPALQATLLEEIGRISVTTTAPKTAERWPVVSESDVSRVRLRAREVATELGGNVYVAQRAATIASELSRNIVAYAKSGVVELMPSAGPPTSLTIRAVDAGPGIGRLDEILAGRYRSKTGLGKGLLGVKRLSARFEVSSGATGTRVEAEVAIA